LENSTDAAPTEAGAEVFEVPETEEFLLSAFEVKLWNPKPRETEAAARNANPVGDRPAPVASLRLRLVGITREKSGIQAALYDPDADRLLVLKQGDRFGQSVLTSLSLSAAEFTTGTHQETLELVPEPKPGGR
jgi:hypothetical protein